MIFLQLAVVAAMLYANELFLAAALTVMGLVFHPPLLLDLRRHQGLDVPRLPRAVERFHAWIIRLVWGPEDGST